MPLRGREHEPPRRSRRGAPAADAEAGLGIDHAHLDAGVSISGLESAFMQVKLGAAAL